MNTEKKTITNAWKNELGDNFAELSDGDKKQWLNSIGNLTLTAYNQEASNKTFASKKKIYDDSSFYMTRQLVKINRFTFEELRGRGHAMSAALDKIYSIPEIADSRYIYNAKNMAQNSGDSEEYSVLDEHSCKDATIVGYEFINILDESKNISVKSNDEKPTWKSFYKEALDFIYKIDEDKLYSLADDKIRFIYVDKPDIKNPNNICDEDRLYINETISAEVAIKNLRFIIKEWYLNIIDIRYIIVYE